MAKNGKPKKRGGRKSKAEGSTGAKENAAEMRSPEIEGLVIADDDFDLHLASLKRAVDATKRAKNGYDAVCKAAKKVSPALLDTIKLAVKMEGKDPDEIKRELEMQGYVLKRSGSHVQLTIHDMLLGDVNEAAYARGKKAGADGLANANPYPKNSSLGDEYDRGWGDGQADLLNVGDGSGLGHNSANAAQDPSAFAE